MWKDVPPFYLYVQEPRDALLVFTVTDDSVVEEKGNVMGSISWRLVELIPGDGMDLVG